jgi:hypothetical protein
MLDAEKVGTGVFKRVFLTTPMTIGGLINYLLLAAPPPVATRTMPY